MKKITLSILVSLISLLSFGQKVVLKGSDTVLPIAQKEAERYMKANPGKPITVVGGGSGVGLAALIDATTDIAMSSRKLKMDERLKLQDAGRAVKETIICYDALSIVVNPANKVGKLTREQVEGIYTGKIKNWKEVGGDDMPIVVYARETSSGTYEFFKEFVIKCPGGANEAIRKAAAAGIDIGPSLDRFSGLDWLPAADRDRLLLIAVTESRSKAEIDKLVTALSDGKR